MHTSIPNKGARPIFYRCKNFLLLCSPTTNRPFSDTKNTKPLIGEEVQYRRGDEKRADGPKLPVLSAFRIKNVHIDLGRWSKEAKLSSNVPLFDRVLKGFTNI